MRKGHRVELSIVTLCALLVLGRRFQLASSRRFQNLLSRAQRWLLRLVVHVRARTQQQLELHVESALDSTAAHLCAQLKDPAMPLILQRSIDHMTESLLPNIKQEGS